MSLIRINYHPSRTQLRIFGGAWFLFVGAWGALAWFKREPQLAMALWLAAIAVPAAGALHAPVIRWFYIWLCYVTYPIGFVVSHVVLAIIYYLVFTPIGLIMRLLRYDPLTRRFDTEAPSYWQLRPTSKPVSSYFRQD